MLAGVAFVVAATVPAFVVGVAAGRAWTRGAAMRSVLLAFGLPFLAWAGFALAVQGEGMGELAVVGWFLTTVCAVVAAGLTALRRAPDR